MVARPAQGPGEADGLPGGDQGVVAAVQDQEGRRLGAHVRDRAGVAGRLRPVCRGPAEQQCLEGGRIAGVVRALGAVLGE